MANGGLALLGIAGSVSATAVSGWLAPALVCASVLLIGRSFYNLYVRGIRTRATTIIAWLSLVFIVGFWTWHLASGVWSAPSGQQDQSPLNHVLDQSHL